MIKKIFYFYQDGFANMKVGKRLWLLIFIKLFILFTIVKFLFPDVLQERFNTDEQRSNYILQQLTQGEDNGTH